MHHNDDDGCLLCLLINRPLLLLVLLDASQYREIVVISFSSCTIMYCPKNTPGASCAGTMVMVAVRLFSLNVWNCSYLLTLIFCKTWFTTITVIDSRLSSLNEWNHVVGAGWTARTSVLLCVWLYLKLLLLLVFVAVWGRDFIFIFLCKILRFLCVFCDTFFIFAERMERYRWSCWMHNSLYVCIAVRLAIIQAGITCLLFVAEWVHNLTFIFCKTFNNYG